MTVSEQVAYVDDELYDKLIEFSNTGRSRTGISDPSRAVEAELYLFREARLLDDRRYEDWLALFAPECIYWVPASVAPGDPRQETSIHLDDYRRLADRIALIRTGYLHAQTPPSRTRRMLTNVETWQQDEQTLLVRSNIAIWEYRHGVMRHYVGWQEHVLTGADGGSLEARHIKYKCINLLNCDASHGNLTFIL